MNINQDREQADQGLDMPLNRKMLEELKDATE